MSILARVFDYFIEINPGSEPSGSEGVDVCGDCGHSLMAPLVDYTASLPSRPWEK